jgi:hypothetical protein
MSKKNKQLKSAKSRLTFLVLYSTMETMEDNVTANKAEIVDEFFVAKGVCPRQLNASFSLFVTKALQDLYKNHPHYFSHINNIYLVFPVSGRVDNINFSKRQTGICDFCGKDKVATKHCHFCGVEICLLCDIQFESPLFAESIVCRSCAKENK